jgi:release factor glutamine methyltransferase
MSHSPSSPSALPFESLVVRLRAAGCVFAEDEARVLIEAASGGADLERMVALRVAGQPLEYVVGWAEFHGLRVLVDPGVFVPRRRTEFLVDSAIALAAPGSVVVDLCCGSGAVAVALLAAIPSARVFAADLDPVAVRCAEKNLAATGATTAIALEGDLFAALPDALRGRVDVLVANAPYVPSDEIRTMPPEARDFEALIALDGGLDGLDVQRRVAAEAPRWLAPGGSLLVETSERQATRTTAIFEAAGLLTHVASAPDIGGTVVIGTLPHGERVR